jgi:hypothetical protein
MKPDRGTGRRVGAGGDGPAVNRPTSITAVGEEPAMGSVERNGRRKELLP